MDPSLRCECGQPLNFDGDVWYCRICDAPGAELQAWLDEMDRRQEQAPWIELG